MLKLIVLVTILTLSSAIQDMSLDNESCDKACYLTYYQSGYTSGYARYKCCLDQNKKLGIPIQESYQPASHMAVESGQAHFSCDTGCISSYQALGYSSDISVKECCFYSNLRASRFATWLETAVDPSLVDPLLDQAAGSDPKPSSYSNTTESDPENETTPDPNGPIYGMLILFSIVGLAVVAVILRYRYPRFCIPFCMICRIFGK